MGPEYTAVALEYINRSINFAVDPNYLPIIDRPRYSSALQPVTPGTIVVPDYYAQAYENLHHWLLNLLYYNSSSNALKPYLVKPSDVKEIAAFIFWGALVAELGYTNGFPYMSPLTSPLTAVTLASWSMLIALLVTIMGLLSFVILEIAKHWNDP